MGDLNYDLHAEDRIGGNPISLPEVAEFQDCIDVSGLIELPHEGKKNTHGMIE